MIVDGSVSQRIRGVVELKHVHDAIGSYGIIRGEDGKVYVFTAGHVYRNCSHAAIGAAVTFEVENGYATCIDDEVKSR